MITGLIRAMRFPLPASLLALLFASAPAASASTPATAVDVAIDTQQLVLQKRRVGTFYLSASIDGLGEFDMLLDTGSSYMVVDERMIDALRESGRVRYSRSLSGIMADGSRREVDLFRLDAIRLGQSCWVSDVEVAVFPAGARPILGMGVLSRLAPFTFSADPAELSVSACESVATPEHTTPTL